MPGPGAFRRELTKRAVNPVVKALASVGLSMPGVVILETTGRKSGEPRRTPVGARFEGRTAWIVSEHGLRSGYVRNIQANPRVRVKHGLRWRAGTAHLMPDDDPDARVRWMSAAHLGLRLNAAGWRAMKTSPMTVRVDLG